LVRDTVNSSSSTGSTKPPWKPGRRGDPFSVANTKAGP
jgi:hypothetical protein